MAGATRIVIDGVSYPVDDATAVDFEEQQTLTDAQKARARSNIGAASQDDMTSVQASVGDVPSGSNLQGEVADLKSAIGKTVSTTPQALTDSEQATARGNIAAASVIYEDTSGPIANFTDGADGGVVEALSIGILPVQTGRGDPSPENVRPITGWTGANVVRAGANICNPDLLLTINNEITKDGNTYKFPRHYTSDINLIPRMNKNFDQIKVRYGLMHENEAIGDRAVIRISYTDGTYTRNISTSSPANTWRDVTVTNEENKTISRVGYSYLRSGGPSYIRDLMINYGAVETQFEPYQGVETPVTWEDVAGTVYGGSVTLNPDGSADVSACPYYDSYSGQTLVCPWISSMDVYTEGATPTTGAQVVDLGGVKTVYHVPSAWAPPILTLLGENNIWADCGPIETLTYPADTKLYIDKGQTEDDMTVSAPIANGTYFMVGNTLYRATAAIATDETIQPGTNCTITTIAEALNALAE